MSDIPSPAVLGLTGVVIATLGTDTFPDTVVLQIGAVLIVGGIIGLGWSLLFDLGIIGSDDPPEVVDGG